MKKFISIKKWLNENQENKPEYGCVMMDATISDWKDFHISGIDPKDVYRKPLDDSYGLEDNPHVTVLFGIHEDEIDPEIIMNVVENSMNMLTVTISNISIFENEEYDVVKYDVPVTDQLQQYRTLFEKNFPNTQTFSEYHPHITIAYVKPGTGKKYVKELDDPFEVTFDKGVYSFHEDGELIRKEHKFKNPEEQINLNVNEWFIPDLEPYNYNYKYTDKKINLKELAVGWLDDNSYMKGEVPENFLEKLKNGKIKERHKGGHRCPFCPRGTSGTYDETYGSRVYSIYYDGINYVYPELLKHYVKVHNYLPPNEFIEAVMNSKTISDKSPHNHGFSHGYNFRSNRIRRK